jgi:hypothetical protein
VEVRETRMEDRDVQRLGPGVAVNLVLLAVQAGLGPGCHILGKTAPDITIRNKLPGSKPLRVGNVQVKKKVFSEFFRHH